MPTFAVNIGKPLLLKLKDRLGEQEVLILKPSSTSSATWCLTFSLYEKRIQNETKLYLYLDEQDTEMDGGVSGLGLISAFDQKKAFLSWENVFGFLKIHDKAKRKLYLKENEMLMQCHKNEPQKHDVK